MTSKTVALFLPKGTQAWSYVYVRYKGTAGRDTSVKFFFTDTTLWINFMRKLVDYGGKIAGVDFPQTSKPPTQEELDAAFKEGRAIP